MLKQDDSTLSSVAALYSERLNIKVTKQTIKDAIEEELSYPSLQSVAEVFTRFGIENQAFQLPSEELKELDPPYLAFLAKGNKLDDFVLVKSMNDQHVEYLDGIGGPKTILKSSFLQNYKQIVFVAEGGVGIQEANYEEKVIQQKSTQTRKTLTTVLSAALLVSLIVLTVYPIIGVESTTNIMVLGASVVATLLGFCCSLLLVVFDVNKKNTLVQSICATGAKNGCEAVLSSKGGKLLGVSWSDIGLTYFSFCVLILLVPFASLATRLALVCAASVLASPYIAFSLIYQWKVVKQWCKLCLGVQFALIGQIAASTMFFISGSEFHSDHPVQVLIMIFVAAVFPALTIDSLKRISLKAKDGVDYKLAYKRMLYNKDIFFSILQSQSEPAPGWEHLGILLGNPHAANTILKVCNPYCGPCAQAHPVLEDIITKNPQYNLRIIMTATNSSDDMRTPVVKHLLALSKTGDEALIKKAVHAWYSGPKDYSMFAKEFQVNSEFDTTEIDRMDQWCIASKIAFTPTIYINGRLMPEMYSIDELSKIF
jgi:uncharacterized membrane protein